MYEGVTGQSSGGIENPERATRVNEEDVNQIRAIEGFGYKH